MKNSTSIRINRRGHAADLVNSVDVMSTEYLSVAAVINVGLFIGSLIFLASGLSFEQFSGMK